MQLIAIELPGELPDFKRFEFGFWIPFQISRGEGASRMIEVMGDRSLLEALLPFAEEFGIAAEIVEEENAPGLFVLEAQGSIGRTDRLLDVLRDQYGVPKLRRVIVSRGEARAEFGEEACQAALDRIRPT